jgi:PKD repeat protein
MRVQSDTEGPPPLLVQLQGGASSASPIIQTGWAFHEADVLEITRTIQPTSSLIESASFEYSTAGNYTAAFHVWNEAGLSQAATEEIIVWTLTPTPTVTETPSPTRTATASETPTVTRSPTFTTTVTPTATAAMATIKEMDLDGDDVISAGDLLRLIPAMRQSQSLTDQHHEGDFNRDGRIDCLDLWLFGNQWGREIVEEN